MLKIKTNKYLILIWRFLISVFGVFGLVTMISHSDSSQILCYFTIQSNMFVTILFLILFAGSLNNVIKHKNETFQINPAWQLAIIFYVQITFLIYASLLSGTTFNMGTTFAISNILLHYVVPIMAILDWLIFAKHGLVKVKHAAYFLIYPAIYVIFSYIRAFIGNPFGDGARYPYFFMDFDKNGYNVIWICTLFFIGFFFLGCLFIWIDKLLKNKLPSQ